MFFEAAASYDATYLLQGLILSIVFGFAAGNYACSLVHRLPRGRLILDKKPYCGNCGAPLQVRDLFPVISAIMLRHRCRYCNTPFPVSHTWTEILVGLLFVFAFLQFNFSEQYLLVAIIGIFWITLAAIEANEQIIMGRIVLCIAISGLIFRVLQDHTLYNSLAGGFYAFIIGAVIWRKQIKPVAHVFTLPKPVELMAVGGLCVGISNFTSYIMLLISFHGADWLTRRMLATSDRTRIGVIYGIAATVLVLCPKFIDLLLTLTPQ